MTKHEAQNKQNKRTRNILRTIKATVILSFHIQNFRCWKLPENKLVYKKLTKAFVFTIFHDVMSRFRFFLECSWIKRKVEQATTFYPSRISRKFSKFSAEYRTFKKVFWSFRKHFNFWKRCHHTSLKWNINYFTFLSF